nr:DUF853 family protein [Geodermatophilaceae bacterium]
APAGAAELAAVVTGSPLHPRYAKAVDRDSAYERLAARIAPSAPVPTRAPDAPPEPRAQRRTSRERQPEGPADMVGEILGSGAFKAFMRSAGTALGRSIFGTRRR